jgi:tripartite-type tricarboxylate transporter receptor subunit TctC
VLFAACVAAAVPAARAQSGTTRADDYPGKPIRIVVPYATGGGTDTIARIIAAGLQERLRQPAIIDNRGGANGVIGTDIVAASPPDGYTLLTCTTAVATNASLYKGKTKYDPVKSFSPVSLAVQATMLLVVSPSLPVRNVKELIALAKSKPGELAFSSYGNGSSPHLAAELFKSMAGVDMIHVPFKGGAPAITEVAAGRVAMTFATISSVLPHVQSGRVKALGAATLERNQRFKDLPTIAEAGLPGFEAAGGWTGICAPAGTPRPIVSKLHAAITDTMSNADVRTRFTNLGYDIFPPMSPDQFAALMRAESQKWAKVVKDFNVKAD